MAPSRQWQLIRSWLRKTYNKEVHEFFKDIDQNRDLNISIGRDATKAVCLIGASDSQSIAEIKRGIFRDLKEKAGLKAGQHSVETLPDFSVEGFPQVQLWFYEKHSKAKLEKRRRAEARISFRVVDTDNFSKADAEAMAKKIYAKFATPVFSFEKGKKKAHYRHKQIGVEFILAIPDIAEAKRIIEAVLDLRGYTPNWDFLSISDKPDETFDVVKPVRVMGKTVRTISRPETRVYFNYAIAKVPPLIRDIPLVDISGRYWNALIKRQDEGEARAIYNRTSNLPLP